MSFSSTHMAARCCRGLRPADQRPGPSPRCPSPPASCSKPTSLESVAPPATQPHDEAGSRWRQHRRRPQHRASGNRSQRREPHDRQHREASGRSPTRDQRGHRARRAQQNRSEERRPCRRNDDVTEVAAPQRRRAGSAEPHCNAPDDRREKRGYSKSSAAQRCRHTRISSALRLRAGAPQIPKEPPVKFPNSHESQNTSHLGFGCSLLACYRSSVMLTLTCSHSHMGRCLILST